jgi:hypothetical protein
VFLRPPLYRNQSKYDLLQKVHFESQQAWDQIENETIKLKIRAEYVLVHFPYFKDEIGGRCNSTYKKMDLSEVISDESDIGSVNGCK